MYVHRMCALGLFIILAILVLYGCDGADRAGTAQHTAVEAEAHAQVARTAAELAVVDAAAKAARASALEEQAIKVPTADRIAAAADARVEAASAQAVSVALGKVAAEADRRAMEASTRAETERQRQAKADSEASWLWWCRAIALGSLVGGAILGGLIGYAAQDPRTGLLVGGGIAGVGMLVLAFGQALPWLAWLVPVGGVIGLAVWAIKHRSLQVAHVDLGKARAILATGYARTADALAKVRPELRRELDRLSIAEQHAAGVLHSNDAAMAAVVVHPETVPTVAAA